VLAHHFPHYYSRSCRWMVPEVSRSHQTFRPVQAVKLLGIMLRNRCWPTTFHTITARDTTLDMVFSVVQFTTAYNSYWARQLEFVTLNIMKIRENPWINVFDFILALQTWVSLHTLRSKSWRFPWPKATKMITLCAQVKCFVICNCHFQCGQGIKAAP
jgi:hypothetical protein